MVGLIRVRELLENAINAKGKSLLVGRVTPLIDEDLCGFELVIQTRLGQEIVDRWPVLSINMKTQEMHRISEHGEQKESLGWLPFVFAEETDDDDDAPLWGPFGVMGRGGRGPAPH
jgi:hypothetical protein